jgi:hypothetical protein
LRKSTRSIMAAMNARAAFAVPGSTGEDQSFMHDAYNSPPVLRTFDTVSKVPAAGDETGELARLAVAMMQLHGAFASRSLTGPRDSDGRSEPLVIAAKAAAAMLREHQQ